MRRDRSSIVPLLLVAWALTLGSCATPRDEEGAGVTPPRHVVLISVDTLRADRLGFHGYRRATSPRLDAIAEHSVVFSRAIAQWPKTGPSFASMFSGLYPQTSGIMHRAKVDVPEELEMLPERFQEIGFTTAAVVSNAVLDSAFGWGTGFDRYVHTWTEDVSNDPHEYRKWLYGGRVNELATELLDELGSEDPLFLWLHYTDPHAPYLLPDDFENPFLDDEFYVEEGEAKLREVSRLGDETQLRYYIAQYDANVLVADHFIGEILDDLEARGILEDALVIFTSDHGEELGEHGLYFEHGPAPYNSSSHVPLFFFHEATLTPRTIERPVELIDVLPTLLDLFIPEAERGELQGVSLAGDLAGLSPEEAKPYAYADAGRHPRHLRSIQDEEWKLIFRPPRGKGRPGPDNFELFHLAEDPLELANLTSERPQILGELRRKLEAWMQDPTPRSNELDEKARKALEAMGYLGGN